jgi:hypothetical protein
LERVVLVGLDDTRISIRNKEAFEIGDARVKGFGF